MNATRPASALAMLAVRADRSALRRYDLAPPETRDSGVVVYEAVLSTPGVSDYPELGITERVTAEALSDDAYLSELAGTPIIDDADRHWSGVSGESLTAARIGTLLDARWDEAQQATIVRLAMDPGRGIEAIRRGMRGLSLRYTPDSVEVADDPDGATHEQRGRRRLNHVLLTDTPRDIAARIRADATGGRMTDEQIKALKAEIIAAIPDRADMDGGDAVSMLLDMLVGSRGDAAKLRADYDALKARMDAMQSEGDGEPDEPRADAWRDVLTRADALDIEVKGDARLDDVRRAIVGKHLPDRADAKGDSLADAYTLTCAALDAAGQSRDRGAAWRQRADSNPTPSSGASAVLDALTY